MSTPTARIHQLRSQVQRLDDEMVGMERGLDDAGLPAEHRRGARNLLHYLALRRNDIRELQRELTGLGLSSLGRAESHVRASVAAVLRVLTQLKGGEGPAVAEEVGPDVLEGRMLLHRNTLSLLGPAPEGREVRIMVTMPPEAATDRELVRNLLRHGMNCMRINCAHDNPAAWAAMIGHLRDAERETGLRCRVQMDVAGPKLRTGSIEPGPAVVKIRPFRDCYGRVIAAARIRLSPLEDTAPPSGSVLLPAQWLARLRPDKTIRFVDARGARRLLVVKEQDGKAWWAEASKSAYVTPGLQFEIATGGGKRFAAPVGPIPATAQTIRLAEGDTLILTREPVPGQASPPRISVSLPEFFESVRPGESIWFDDGLIGGVITLVTGSEAHVQITRARPGGEKLGAEKGINVPDTDLRTPAITAEDLAALEFIAANADIVGFSFVRDADDVRLMRMHLEALGRPEIGIVLKIETRRGFQNLPQILLEAMKCKAVGVMIARGDLAVECGFERLAEIQEEILWIAESAYVPVIWATQVLETLAKTGRPSRSEITDAAMGERAECVMLNKGRFVVDAVRVLDDILKRMESHQEKKSARLRKLQVAAAFPARD